MKVYLQVEENQEIKTIPEVLMLEFQGELESHLESYKSVKLGDLYLENNKYILDIGIHRLEGKKEKINKPILVTKNKVESYTEASLTVMGICREKIIFNKRPTPILEHNTKQIKK